MCIHVHAYILMYGSFIHVCVFVLMYFWFCAHTYKHICIYVFLIYLFFFYIYIYIYIYIFFKGLLLFFIREQEVRIKGAGRCIEICMYIWMQA